MTVTDHDDLLVEITHARSKQLQARTAWARSPNGETIAAEATATRELDVLLERLHAALRR